MFSTNSRYIKQDTQQTMLDGRTIAYVVPRACPADEGVAQWRVAQAERLDLVAWRALGDPTAFWRVADCNPTLDPFDLTDTPGRRIALPARR